ncbi:unnamed protein product, partial [Iphiclides podalirius]
MAYCIIYAGTKSPLQFIAPSGVGAREYRPYCRTRESTVAWTGRGRCETKRLIAHSHSGREARRDRAHVLSAPAHAVSAARARDGCAGEARLTLCPRSQVDA